MTIAIITPQNIIPDNRELPNVAPHTREAHRYCREQGYNDYCMIYDSTRGRGLFISNPWDIPVMRELRYRGVDHGGWTKR